MVWDSPSVLLSASAPVVNVAIETTTGAVDGTVSALSSDSTNELFTFNGTWGSTLTNLLIEQTATPGSVSIDQAVYMGTNCGLATNDVHFYPIEPDKTLFAGAETKVSLTTSPLTVATKSDFYKDMAVVNDTTNHQAVALDVPCGLRPTQLIENEWAMISVCHVGTMRNDTGASIVDIFGDDDGCSRC